MALLNPLNWFRREETKASTTGPAVAALHVGRPVWTSRDYAKLADEAYVRNAVGYRCIKLISSSAAAVPWLLYRGDQEVAEHPLLDLLSRPAPMIGGHDLFEAWYAYLLLAGNTYLEGVGPRNGPPRELWSLRPDRMTVIPGREGLPAGYEYKVGGQKLRWDVDRASGRSPVLHVREFHPLNDWYGLSRVDPAAYPVDRHNAAQAHNTALLQNGARPSGALIFQPVSGGTGSAPQHAPKDVIEAAEERLLERHGGPENAGRPMVLGGNIKWEEMGLSPRDMDFGSGKDDAARDICVAFGVPHILIVHGESTYNNVREAKFELWENTILPLIDKTVDAFNAWLAPQFGDDLRLDVDLDEISALEPRRETKRTSVTALLDKRLITRDEAREALQYGPWPEGAVGDVDGQVLAALINAIDSVGIEPLVRYMKFVGLIDAGTTPEQVLDAALAMLPGAEDIAAATTPPARPNGAAKPNGADRGAQVDADANAAE